MPARYEGVWGGGGSGEVWCGEAGTNDGRGSVIGLGRGAGVCWEVARYRVGGGGERGGGRDEGGGDVSREGEVAGEVAGKVVGEVRWEVVGEMSAVEGEVAGEMVAGRWWREDVGRHVDRGTSGDSEAYNNTTHVWV